MVRTVTINKKWKEIFLRCGIRLEILKFVALSGDYINRLFKQDDKFVSKSSWSQIRKLKDDTIIYYKTALFFLIEFEI